MLSRRRFLSRALGAVPGALAASGTGGRARTLSAAERRALGFPVPAERWHGDSSAAAARRAQGLGTLRRGRDEPEPDPSDPLLSWRSYGRTLGRFRDLRRHFVFEYYPWYDTDPWAHWSENLRTPPWDIAASSVPRLGAYDTDHVQVIEQHARWMADAGIGAINLSWWGPGSPEDRRVPLVMDVMRAHDIHVMFHLEPYADDRPAQYGKDVAYLLREYGDRRRWDALLLLEGADGRACPVFKSFRTILPPTVVDCLGAEHRVPDYAADSVWHRQTDAVRAGVGADFDRIVLLADSTDYGRTSAAGFDGMAIYDPFVRPAGWLALARNFSTRDLLFSFNVNPGFDKYPTRGPVDVCFRPIPFEPAVAGLDWNNPDSRSQALESSRARILESMATTLQLQLDPRYFNERRGFFLVFINSFNEWHEGTAFEPAKSVASLAPEERAVGYHNPPDGAWRLTLLQDVLFELLAGAAGR